ncbi:MAG: glycosyltransferase [Bacteroidota bacterium]
MDNFKLTIVTIVYNDVDNITKTIKSVLGLKTNLIEYIVIDGLSKDGTVDKISAYKSEIDCFISEKDNGIYDAMNKALKLAKGDSIIFMNSGDIFSPEFNLSALIEHYDLLNDIIIGFSIQTYKGDSYLRPNKLRIDHLVNYPAHQAIFVPKKCYKRVCFRENLKIAGDYYWIQDVMKIAGYKIEEKIISVFTLGGKSTSNKFADIYMVFKEMGVRFLFIKTFVKFLLFNILGRKMAFRLIYKSNYKRL